MILVFNNYDYLIAATYLQYNVPLKSFDAGCSHAIKSLTVLRPTKEKRDTKEIYHPKKISKFGVLTFSRME